MHIRSSFFWCMACFGLACVVACSDDSGVDSVSPGSGSEEPGGDVVIGEDGQPIATSSSATGDVPLSQGGTSSGAIAPSSSSKKDDGSHDGPLPGEDQQMVPVDPKVDITGFIK